MKSLFLPFIFGLALLVNFSSCRRAVSAKSFEIKETVVFKTALSTVGDSVSMASLDLEKMLQDHFISADLPLNAQDIDSLTFNFVSFRLADLDQYSYPDFTWLKDAQVTYVTEDAAWPRPIAYLNPDELGDYYSRLNENRYNLAELLKDQKTITFSILPRLEEKLEEDIEVEVSIKMYIVAIR